ncbi:MAG: hypothetical protein V7K43_04570 [Nostoc sp.]
MGAVEVELSIIQPYQLACSWIKVFVPAASLIRTAINYTILVLWRSNFSWCDRVSVDYRVG